MMEIRIRPAVPADAERMEELYRLMRKAIYGPADQKGYEAGYLDRFFGPGGNRAYVVEAAGRTVAFISLVSRNHLSMWTTSPWSRRFGGRASGRGCWTWPRNTPGSGGSRSCGCMWRIPMPAQGAYTNETATENSE